jgi:death-on-curing protein
VTWYPTRDEILATFRSACGFEPIVGDEGLLEAAIARPQTSVFGEDAYPTVLDKAAALMHSLAKNHAFVDGNKRTAWGAAWLMLGLNGIDIADEIDDDEAEQFVISAATADMDWRKVSAGLAKYVTRAQRGDVSS